MQAVKRSRKQPRYSNSRNLRFLKRTWQTPGPIPKQQCGMPCALVAPDRAWKTSRSHNLLPRGSGAEGRRWREALGAACDFDWSSVAEIADGPIYPGRALHDLIAGTIVVRRSVWPIVAPAQTAHHISVAQAGNLRLSPRFRVCPDAGCQLALQSHG